MAGGLPEPRPPQPADTLVTELFQIAVGWIILHESAHVLFGHAMDGQRQHAPA